MTPSTHVGGACTNEGVLRRLLGAGDALGQLRALACDGRTAGGDERFASQQTSMAIFPRCGAPHRILSQGKAQAVETGLAVVGLPRRRDPRLARLQCEAQRAEPLGDQLLAVLYTRAVLMEHPQVVSVDHHLGGRSVLAASVWEGLRESCFQPVEGDMRQEGGQGIPLYGTGLCGKERAVGAHTSVEPRPPLAPQVWTRCELSEEGVMRQAVERWDTFIPLSTTHRETIRRKSRSPIPPIHASGVVLCCSRPARALTVWAISSSPTATRCCCVFPTWPPAWSPHRPRLSPGLN